MPPHRPRSLLATHEVANQPQPLGDVDLAGGDPVLLAALRREGAGWAEDQVRAFGKIVGSEEVRHLGELANRHPPELRPFDRWGRRLDEVEYHPGYHELMRLGMAHGYHNIAWTAGRPGGHVAHAALGYLLTQAEPGVCCPLTMTYAAVPALSAQSELAAEWLPRLLASDYDPRALPASDKRSATMGMAMTEKQGGSDVRANATVAVPEGSDGAYRLTGHKWFCSAPMSDAFLTLAHVEGHEDRGLTCFLVPRWTPDGERNAIEIQRLKDKLGNRSNASSEIEYRGAWAQRLGEEGRGVRTIIEMVHHTRLDTTFAPAALMRSALFHAVHHATQRRAFQRHLIDQPLMRGVLADLALEWEAATTLVFRVARAFDEGHAGDASARAFARLAVAAAKYWLNKRCPTFVAEAMEVLGGGGYVEEAPLARLYREAPLNGIWEGSGNVICLDILRTVEKEPDSLAAVLAELDTARGGDAAYDAALSHLQAELRIRAEPERRARRIAEQLALLLQGSLLIRHAPPAVADAFCQTRLFGDHGYAFGTLPTAIDLDGVLERVGVATP